MTVKLSTCPKGSSNVMRSSVDAGPTVLGKLIIDIVCWAPWPLAAPSICECVFWAERGKGKRGTAAKKRGDAQLGSSVNCLFLPKVLSDSRRFRN